MELSNWAPEHSDALREFIAKGMSFSEAAQAINSRFNTSYTRSAALGRARRLRLEADDRQTPSMPTKPVDLRDIAEPPPSALRMAALLWPTPVFKEIKPVKLRCVGIEPRHLSLFELERAIAVPPMAAMKRVRPSPSAVIRGARDRAIARPIFT